MRKKTTTKDENTIKFAKKIFITHEMSENSFYGENGKELFRPPIEVEVHSLKNINSTCKSYLI